MHVRERPLQFVPLQPNLPADMLTATVCVRQKLDDNASPEVIIVDLKNGNNIIRRPIKADSAIMHWNKQIIALKAQQRTLQIFDLGAKAKLKSTTMNEDVVFWKWFNDTSLGLVTDTSVYHWNIFDPNQAAPVKVFDRNANLSVSTNVHECSIVQLSFAVGLPNHQLPCKSRREVDGGGGHIATTRPCRRSNATIL